MSRGIPTLKFLVSAALRHDRHVFSCTTQNLTHFKVASCLSTACRRFRDEKISESVQDDQMPASSLQTQTFLKTKYEKLHAKKNKDKIGASLEPLPRPEELEALIKTLKGL